MLIVHSLLALGAGLRQPVWTRQPRMSSSDDAEECVVIKFVTGNNKKLREVDAILDKHGLPLPLQQCELDLDEIQCDIPEKIAAAKCSLAAKITGGPVLVDDTSLCIKSFGGLPGPYIKWWFVNNTTRPDVLSRMLDGFDDKSAYALSCVAFAVGPDTVPVVFTGRVNGKIVEPCAGEQPGWDRSFRPDGHDRTFAQMDLEQKNAISHRALALRALSSYLKEHRDLLVRLCDASAANPNPPKSDNTRFHRRRASI